MRGMMLGVFGVVIGSILSILVAQYFDQGGGSRSTQPPDPLVVDPQHAAEQTKKLP
ncbi:MULTISPECIES: hypothetical protein [unclassified Rhizobium]|uniref:hypothetical protein n=1 Tax=unclassified Rhizobium TaxID=2613769 RepID=UPI000B2FB622|nr:MULTISPECIES: hypothetical protein [unclassified Rhizobium]